MSNYKSKPFRPKVPVRPDHQQISHAAARHAYAEDQDAIVQAEKERFAAMTEEERRAAVWAQYLRNLTK
jgi:hypothetical protein